MPLRLYSRSWLLKTDDSLGVIENVTLPDLCVCISCGDWGALADPVTERKEVVVCSIPGSIYELTTFVILSFSYAESRWLLRVKRVLRRYVDTSAKLSSLSFIGEFRDGGDEGSRLQDEPLDPPRSSSWPILRDAFLNAFLTGSSSASYRLRISSVATFLLLGDLVPTENVAFKLLKCALIFVMIEEAVPLYIFGIGIFFLLWAPATMPVFFSHLASGPSTWS